MTLDGAPVNAAAAAPDGRRVSLRFDADVVVNSGSTLRVELRW